MPTPTLYIYSSSELEYSSNPAEDVYYYEIKIPEEIVLPANSVVNIDMKLRICMYCPNTDNRMYGVSVIPTNSIITTPLVHALGCTSMTNSTGAVDLFIPLRNVTDTAYTISSGTALLQFMFKQYDPFRVRFVESDHIMME